jgi:membrane protease YdiL (CAAX protease family)
MNVLVMLAVAAGALCVLWAVQSVVLKLAGESLAWPLRFTTRKPAVRLAMRVMIHVSWLIILIGTPLALGIRPLDALHQAFPLPIPWRDIMIGFSVMYFPAMIAYALMIGAGWVRIQPQFDRATRRAKLLRRLIGPILLATLEEAVFRGVLLEQMIRALPESRISAALAIVASAAVFSLVHFVKPAYPGKPIWQPAYGLFIVGCLLGLAYILGGRSLWLPIALHAAAVYVVEVMKLYVVFRAPAWLVGYPESPQSGLCGSVFLPAVAIALIVLI